MSQTANKYTPGLVSVVVPCYNAQEYIAETIDSVLIQNYKNWEIVIVIDGATDNSEKVVRQYMDKGVNIKLFIQENQGVSAARNAGIQNAQGEFIAFLDSDDVWLADNLEKKIAFLNENQTVSWVYSDMYMTDGRLRITEIVEGGSDENLLVSLLARKGDVIHAPSNIVVRTQDLINSELSFDSNLSTSADWEFCIQMAAAGLAGKRIPEPLWLYRVLDTSMSRNLERIEHDNLYVQRKAAKQKLFPARGFRRQCFSNNYLVLAGIWWVNGGKKMKALWYILISVYYYPLNFLKIINKFKRSEVYQAKRTVIGKDNQEIIVQSNTSFSTRKKVTVFLLHRVNVIRDPLWNPVHPERFEQIIAYLVKHYEVVPLQAYLLNKYVPKTNKPLCAVGFDDGYKDFITYALPILAKYKCPSSMYVVAECINNNLPPWTYILNHHFINTKKTQLSLEKYDLPALVGKTRWSNREEKLQFAKAINGYLKKVKDSLRREIYDAIIAQLDDVEMPYGLMMTWDEVKELRKHGCEVGSHSLDHPVLSQIESQEILEKELRESARIIREKTGIAPETIAYPFGAHNQLVKQAAEAAGYKIGVAVNPVTYDNSKFDRFGIPRIELYDEPMLITLARLSQYLPKIKKLLFHK